MTDVRTSLILALTLLLTVACSATLGDGVQLIQDRTISEAFDSIRVSDGLAAEVRLDTTNAGDVIVTSDSNLVPLIETVVSNGVLEISAAGIDPTLSTLVVVTMPSLASASAADEGADIMVADIDRTGTDAAGTIAINLSEKASATLSGTCNHLIAIVSGESTLNASGLACRTGELDVLEQAVVDVQLTESAIVRASGSSTIRITGGGAVQEFVSDDVTVTTE